ncbi:MAG: hypothetical protein AAGI90_00260 [Chlamydiota bacterium]
MPISIGGKYAPFSRSFVCKLPILRTDWVATIYPTEILLENGSLNAKITHSFTGPFSTFLCVLNAENGRIEISGKAQEGYFRFHLVSEKNVAFLVKKKPADCNTTFSGFPLEKIPVQEAALSQEKLSLGSHKKQEIEEVRRRGTLEEILPLWHRIATFYPAKKPAPLVDQNLLLRTFWSEFSGIFCPEKDPFRLRIPSVLEDPFSYGSSLIATCFFFYKNNTLHFLPKKWFPFGKMTGIFVEGVGHIDFSWSKNKMRMIHIHGKKEAKVHLSLPGLKTVRLSANRKILEKKRSLKDPLLIEEGRSYVLDRFER